MSLVHSIESKHVMKGDIVQLLQQQQQQQHQQQPPDCKEAQPLSPPSSSSAPPQPPKGRNVSGRSWKVRPQKRASSLIKTQVNNQAKSWEQRQAAKLAQQQVKELQAELREQKRQDMLQKQERRRENEKRRAENELKAMERSVQTLNIKKIGTTLKAMSKKQLRQVKKTRVNPKTGVVEYVPAYAK